MALCNGRRQSAALDWSAHLQCLSYLGGLDCILLGLHHLDGRYARYGEMARAGYRIRPVFRLIRRRFRKGGAAFIGCREVPYFCDYILRCPFGVCRSPSFLRANGFRATSITTRSRVVNKRPSNKVYWRYMTADVLRRGVSVSGGIEAVLFFCIRACAGRRIHRRGVWSVGFCPGAGRFPDCGFVTPAHRNCDLVRGFLLLATVRDNRPAAS